MSCAATAGLTYWFADLNTTQAAKQAIAGLPVALPITPTITPTITPPITTTPVAPGPTAAVAVPTASASSPAATVAPPTVAVTAVAAPATQAFNGQVIDTRYGPVQVQVQVTSGVVSDVAVVQYPNSDGKSVRINARALPRLRTEALAAQSARVDSISGATYTSDGYVQSLQSAIDAARAAGVTSLV